MGSYRFKIILAGDEAVGKTSTILRFVHNTYSEMYKPTLGFQISVKNLNYKSPPPFNEERIVIFSIWDIAGQGQFAGVRKGYYQNTDGVILMFDLTRRKTFENAKFWADEIRTVAPNAPIILVGNKADLPNQAVLPQELTYTSNENKFASYAISSAATGRGVDEIFRLVAESIIGAISATKAPVQERPIMIFPGAPVTPPAVVQPEAQPPATPAQTPMAPVEVTPPVQRQPRVIPQLVIKLPEVRNVPQAPPVEVAPVVIPPTPISPPVEVPTGGTPPAPVVPRVEVKPVVVPPLHIIPETPEVNPPAIQPVGVPPAPVEVPVMVEPPVAPPTPVVVPVVTESPVVSPAPEAVPETVASKVPFTSTPFMPKSPEAEGAPPKPKKRSLWQRLFNREK